MGNGCAEAEQRRVILLAQGRHKPHSRRKKLIMAGVTSDLYLMFRSSTQSRTATSWTPSSMCRAPGAS
jgi:hypothetical protein